MSRGGYRPGAGRKKGGKIERSEASKLEKEEIEKIKGMLSLGAKVKAKLFNDYLHRVNKGEKISLQEKKLMDKVESELRADLITEKRLPLENETPLEFMLRIMNDPTEDKEFRSRMAVAAAPFVHTRKGEGGGKKEELSDKVDKAGQGRFAPGKSPLRAVK